MVERKNRFGAPFYSCERYPECMFAVSNPPIKDHPCPECGSLLLQRPKSVKCWNCGAELDLDFHVTKEGDPGAEAAVRAAKAVARDARAKAKKKPTAKSAAKKTAARRKTAAKRKPSAKKKPAAKRVSATSSGAAALAAVPDVPEA